MIPFAASLSLALLEMNPGGGRLLGSCFPVGFGIFATTAHAVIGASNIQLAIPSVTNVNDYQDTSDNTVQYAGLEIAAIDPILDIAIVKGDFEKHPFLLLSGTDSVSVGDDLLTIGFPHTDMGRKVLTCFSVQVGARVLVESRSMKIKQIVINTQARPGQSGSPVINKEGRAVAMLTGSFIPGQGGIIVGGINPHTLHQTTHAVSAEYIAKMLHDA